MTQCYGIFNETKADATTPVFETLIARVYCSNGEKTYAVVSGTCKANKRFMYDFNKNFYWASTVIGGVGYEEFPFDGKIYSYFECECAQPRCFAQALCCKWI